MRMSIIWVLICFGLFMTAGRFEIKDSNANIPGGQAGFAGHWQSATEALEYNPKLQ
jgi:hypothetical protein